MLILLELTVNKLTVGKIYAGLLIAENWKSYKATKVTQKNGGGPTGGGTAAVTGTASVSSCITVSEKCYNSHSRWASFCLWWFASDESGSQSSILF